MDLNLEQLRSITLGAVQVRQQEDGFVFSRFTDEQLALYKNTTAEYQKNFHEKACYPAGVKLSFRTDSLSLQLKAAVNKTIGVRRFFSVDVTVNGKYLDSLDNFSHNPAPEDYINVPYELGAYEKTFCLGQGEKTVCVYLPWSILCVLQQVALDEGASLEPVKPTRKLLVFGDSITQGYDARRPWQRPVARLAEMLDAEEITKAIGGERFCPALARLKEDFVPDYIYVAYGTNDWGTGERNAFEANSKAFFAILREHYPTTPILAVTPIWRANWQDQKAFGPFETIERGIREAVAPYENVHVLRGFDFVPHDPAYFSDLRLHPNSAGFAHYGDNLLAAVEALEL